MSSILRSAGSPEQAGKLQKFIDSLREGMDVVRAAARAGLDDEQAGQFLRSLSEYLGRHTTMSSDPSYKPKTGLHVSAVSDGASRGNPGDAACAVIISDGDGDELLRRAKLLGKATNNVAEYEGVILAIELAQSLGASELSLRLDSELVVKQLNGQYKVKNAALKPLYERSLLLSRKLARFTVTHVPRSQTKEADKLANAALDGDDDA